LTFHASYGVETDSKEARQASGSTPLRDVAQYEGKAKYLLVGSGL